MDDVLSGSPYLLATPGHLLADLSRFEEYCSQGLRRVRQKLADANLLTTLADPVQGAREVYESNAIEGLGPDLPRTLEILQGSNTSFVSDGFNQTLFLEAIKGDADLNAVLGLEGARILSRRMAATANSRLRVTEYEIRALHSIVCHGESFAGMYKKWHVYIGGPDAHEPHLPIDVSSSMRDLVEWVNTTECPSPVLRAAVAHAWLTHIHPFEDGNGRIARLLANQILSAGNLPPAIIKNRGQRSSYLDALRRSDDGDILPFVHIFRDTLDRYVREIGKERFLRKVLRAEVNRRGQSDFDAWVGAARLFLNALYTELRLGGLQIHERDFADEEAYSLLRERNKAGNTWITFIRDDTGRVLLLWLGYQSSAMSRPKDASFNQPSIFLSVANNWTSLSPYRQVTHELGGLTEVSVMADLTVYAALGSRLRVGTHSDAASEVADAILSAFRTGALPIQEALGSVSREGR